MDVKRVEVAVVGGGIAGAAAAATIGSHGVRVRLIDDHPGLGGHYLAGGRKAETSWTDCLRRRGLHLIENLPRFPVDVLSRTEVIGLEEGFQLLTAGANGGLSDIACERLLLATGARERFIPFSGWTLPGVLSTGAAQILIKQSGVLPANDTLVGGAGLFLTRVSRDIQKNGGRVPAVLDEAPFFRKVPTGGLLFRNLAKFTLGGILLARLRLAGTALCGSTRILEARGIDNLQEVITGRVDPAGAVIPGSESVYRSDGLAVGFGFTANIELAQLAGCDMAFNTGLGGWVVKVNEDLATTVDGIFAAGEITGIGGAAKSLIEGRLAGLTILRQMGRLRSDKRIKEISALKQARRRQIAFASHFNAQHWFAPPYMTNWISRLPDDLLVCRCEEVSLGDLRRAIAEGFGTPAGIKKATRCGMGICQGSTCKTILLEMLSVLTGQPLAHLPLPSVRVPVKPVYLGTLAGGGL